MIHNYEVNNANSLHEINVIRIRTEIEYTQRKYYALELISDNFAMS